MIPDYQTIMLPLLKLMKDGQEYKLSEATEMLANQFKLTEDEKKELLPSGQQAIFINRVGWARTYLKKAGLIDSSKKGYTKITERGISVLKQNLPKINVAFLKQFPEFITFQNLKREDNSTVNIVNIEEDINHTPNELLENSYLSIKKELSNELLKRIMDKSPDFFENLVLDLLIEMGYGGSLKDAKQTTKRSNDEGIDGIIKEDKLGLDTIYIQAKRWNGTVGRPEIQKFVGALAGHGVKKGVFITTSSFSKEAWEYTPRNETKIVLIDGELLCQLMIDFNLGVSIRETYEIKEIDSDYFEED